MELTDAVKEAYAVAPTNVVILNTIELRHPAFVDDLGAPTSLRVVLDHVQHTLTLESDAPEDPGAAVVFEPMTFKMTLPKLSADGVPTLQLSINNVGELIVSQLDAAIEDGNVIGCTYRGYLSTVTTAPQHGPLHFNLGTPVVTDFQVTAEATFDDESTRSFPGFDYDLANYPALAPLTT